MGYLMGHQGLYSRIADRSFEIEDGAGIFQPSESGFGLYVTTFFKGVRSDVLDIEREYLQGIGIAVKTDRLIFRIYVIIYRYVHRVSRVVDGKIRDTHHHDLWGEG